MVKEWGHPFLFGISLFNGAALREQGQSIRSSEFVKRTPIHYLEKPV